MTAKQSVQYFGFYMVLVGLGFLFFPNVILGIFGLGATSESWIRLLGLLSLVTGGFYYQSMVRHNIVEFYRFTVLGRVVFAVGTAVMVIGGLIGGAGYLFAGFEFGCVMLTLFLLQKETTK
jgi:uncharacterized protein YjeT (DUF2065 family)